MSEEKRSLNFNSKDAIIAVTELSTEAEIAAYTKDDHRKTVIEAANRRLKELGSSHVLVPAPEPERSHKTEQTGKLTETKDTPSGGVKGTKALTCEDVLRKQNQAGG